MGNDWVWLVRGPPGMGHDWMWLVRRAPGMGHAQGRPGSAPYAGAPGSLRCSRHGRIAQLTSFTAFITFGQVQ